MADVLQIEGSGVSNEEYGYALKAHFDFVVADLDSTAEFLVEFRRSSTQDRPRGN